MKRFDINSQIGEIAWEIYKSGEKFVYLTLKNDLVYANTMVGANLNVVIEGHKHLGHIFTLNKDYKEIKKEVRRLMLDI